jgi:hypothetical protein
MDNPCYYCSGHIFDSPVMKLGQNACLGNCLDEFDGSGERSRAIIALLFEVVTCSPEIAGKTNNSFRKKNTATMDILRKAMEKKNLT